MIVHYNKVDPKHRSLVRSIQSKGYSGYIRYLLVKRMSCDRIRKELLRLGLSWNERDEYIIYFREVMYPLVKKYKLTKYYKTYQYGLSGDTLTFRETFQTSETDRANFIDLCRELEIDDFIVEEVFDYYGGRQNLPNHPSTGKPLIENERPIDLVGILQNPKRHVIERLLLDGYSHKQISGHLFQRYDMDLPAEEIKVYAKNFYNVQRTDMERTIDLLQEEKANLENQLREVRDKKSADFTVGERYETLSVLTNKITQLDSSIKRLSGVHTDLAFSAGALEIADVKEMWTDVMVRAHRRFREMDDRTEDEVVQPLNTLASMMDRSTNNILKVDGILNQEQSKSIQEEIAEVYMPTLDRLEQEKNEAFYEYKKHIKQSEQERTYEEEDELDILGYD